MPIFVKEYDWMWNELGLSPAECRVYGYIYGLTNAKHSKEKGYKGSVRQLAKDLGLGLGHTSVTLRKLQSDKHIVLTDGVYTSVLLQNISVPSENGSVPSQNGSVPSQNSPHTPLYKESLNDNNIQSKPKATDMDSVAGLEVDFSSLALFTEYYQLFPYRAKNDRIKQAAQTEFCSLDPERQQLIIDTLRQQIDNDEKLPDTSPLMYIRHFDKNAPPTEGEPVNYNNGSIPDDKFVQPAKYKGQWGMYCLADILKFNLETKQEQ